MLTPLLLLALEAPVVGISSASFEPESGYVSFTLDPEVDLDWRSFAEHKFASHSLDRPSKQTTQSMWATRDMFDGVERSFDYPPPPPIANAFHYLISSQGALPLRIAKLRGAIGYTFDHEKPALNSVAYHGSVLAAAPKRTDLTGGFVFSSPRPLRIDANPLPRNAVTAEKTANVLRVTYAEASRSWTGETDILTQSPEPKYVLLFRVNPGSRSYLFIQWMPDESNCEFAFSLFLIDFGGLKPVKWTAYNCDV